MLLIYMRGMIRFSNRDGLSHIIYMPYQLYNNLAEWNVPVALF